LVDLFNNGLNSYNNDNTGEFYDYFIDGISNFDDFSPLMKLRILKKLILSNNNNINNDNTSEFKDIISKYLFIHFI